MWRSACVALLMLVAPVTASPAAEVPTPAAEDFFKPPEFSSPAVSPDGRNVGFIALSNGHTSLFKLDLKTGQLAGIFSAGTGDVDFFWWVGNDRVLVSAEGQDGRVYFAQDLNDSPPRAIPSLAGWRPKSIRILPHDHDHVVAFYFWGEEYLARINLLTGRSSKIESFNSFADYTVISRDGEIRAKIWPFGGKWHIAWRATAKAPWHTIESDAYSPPVFTPWGMAADDRHILVLAHDHGDAEVLMSLDPETDRRTILAERPGCSPTQLLHVPPASGPVGACFGNFDREEVSFFDPASERLYASIRGSLPQGLVIRLTSSSDDGALRIIEAWVPGAPSRFYLLDQNQHRLSVLGEERPKLDPARLASVRYFKFRTRDGLEESGYVLVPSGRPPANLPLIVIPMQVVGEPGTPSNLYNPQNQYWASRGYAVAHFAVRGSHGFGQRFLQAGDFQCNGKIVEDYEDGVAALAAEGLVDPKRVALIGNYTGGTFALRTAAFSKAFHAVVAISPSTGSTATSIGWMSSSRAEIDVVIRQAGGTKAAYELARQFTPEGFIHRLSTPALLLRPYGIDRSAYPGCEFYRPEPGEIPEHETYEASEVRFLGRIADFLDKNLR